MKGFNSGKTSVKKILAIIIFCLIIFGAFAFWLNNRIIVETISYGELVVNTESSGLVIRDEEVIKSPEQGEIDLHKSEGERVSYGEKILTINNEEENIPIFADDTGVVSFAVDGLEDFLSPDSIMERNIKKVKTKSSNYSHLVSGHEIARNESLYRIVDNRRIYLLVFISFEWSEKINEGETIFIQPQGAEERFAGNILRNFTGNDESYVLIRIESFPDRWLNKREVEVEMIKDIFHGLKVPKSAVFNTPEGRGVLKLSDRENYQFNEITLVAEDKEYLIVEGLEIGDQIVVNPQQLNYGREE